MEGRELNFFSFEEWVVMFNLWWVRWIRYMMCGLWHKIWLLIGMLLVNSNPLSYITYHTSSPLLDPTPFPNSDYLSLNLIHPTYPLPYTHASPGPHSMPEWAMSEIDQDSVANGGAAWGGMREDIWWGRREGWRRHLRGLFYPYIYIMTTSISQNEPLATVDLEN